MANLCVSFTHPISTWSSHMLVIFPLISLLHYQLYLPSWLPWIHQRYTTTSHWLTTYLMTLVSSSVLASLFYLCVPFTRQQYLLGLAFPRHSACWIHSQGLAQKSTSLYPVYDISVFWIHCWFLKHVFHFYTSYKFSRPKCWHGIPFRLMSIHIAPIMFPNVLLITYTHYFMQKTIITVKSP